MIGQADQVLLGSKKNCLIVKDDVGRAKPATRRLPSKDFAFGKTNEKEEGAGTIVNSW